MLTLKDIQSGTVLSMGDIRFSTCIVRKVEDGLIHLERPYAFVSGSDTICPTVLLGCERFTIREENLRNFTKQGNHLSIVG
jgi:hypothetical protein